MSGPERVPESAPAGVPQSVVTAFEQWVNETADMIVNGPEQAREEWGGRDVSGLLLRAKVALVQARALEARHIGTELMIRSGTNSVTAGLWDRSSRLEKFGVRLGEKHGDESDGKTG